jgi:hypothetical protein
VRARYLPLVMAAIVVAAFGVAYATHGGSGARQYALGRSRTDAGFDLSGMGGVAGLMADTPITPPDHFDGAPAAAPPPAALAHAGRVVPSGGTWAVTIGINNYPGTSHDLHSAVADADDVNLALAQMGVPGDHRLSIRDGQATSGVVTQAADWLVAHAAPDAVAVFFYAGHVRKLTSTTEAIISAEGAEVTDQTLADHLRPLAARRAWIGIAACFGGGFTEVLAPGRVLTAAAGANSLAYENPTFGRSYMVEFMVRQAMIDNRAPASVQDAFNYATAAIAQQYPNREPVEIDDGSGPLSLRPPSAGPPPPPAPSSAGGQDQGQQAQAASQPSPSPQSPPPADGGSSPPGTAPPGQCKGVALGNVVSCK